MHLLLLVPLYCVLLLLFIILIDSCLSNLDDSILIKCKIFHIPYFILGNVQLCRVILFQELGWKPPTGDGHVVLCIFAWLDTTTFLNQFLIRVGVIGVFIP